MSLRSVCSAAVLCAVGLLSMFGQAPRIAKVDPPNWWVNMPAPMLLVNGENLAGARFMVSGVALDHTTVSKNGHWAQLWLREDAAKAGEVTITAETARGKAALPFRFERRRAETDGFAGFSSRDVMYLIMTDRFADGDHANDGPDAKSPMESDAARDARRNPHGWHGGDLRGITDHLDYLKALGINTVWITPVYQNHEAGSYHGYGATDLYAVDEHYGSMEDLKALSAGLHARGMKLVLDVVPNHVGAAHPWVKDEPEPTWFHGTLAKHTSAQEDFQPLTDPHAAWSMQRDVTEGWFVNVLPDNNQGNAANSTYLIQNTIWWTEEAGLDGLRIDTFPYVDRPFWQRFHKALGALYPKLTSVGEVSGNDPQINSSFAGGVTRDGVDTGLWTPLDYPMYHAISGAFSGAKPLAELVRILRQDSLYPHPERLVPFLDNHDVARFASTPGASLASGKLAMAFLLTVRGMPQMYTGDELYMQGWQDPDNRRDFPGGFGSDKAVGKDAFDPARRSPVQTEMFDWTHDLLALRTKTPALQTGSLQVLYAVGDSLVFTRTEGDQRVLVALHRGGDDVTLHVPTMDTVLAGRGSATTLLGGGSVKAEASGVAVTLPANGVVIAAMR